MNNIEIEELFLNELSFFTICNSAPDLEKFFKEKVNILSPNSKIYKFIEFKHDFNNDYLYAKIVFNKGNVGAIYLILKKEDAYSLGKYAIERKLNTKNEEKTWDDMTLPAVEEIFNILGGNMTEILSVVYKEPVYVDVPDLKEKNDSFMEFFDDDEEIVVTSFDFDVLEKINIKMYELSKKSFFDSFLNNLTLKQSGEKNVDER